MVLVNGLTIDDINAALIALQRGQGEVVGGVKNTTVQNISINNSGGSGGPDFTPQIIALQDKAEELDERVETLEGKQEETDESIELLTERLNNVGVRQLVWYEPSRQLTIVNADNSQVFAIIPSETATLNLEGNNLVFTMGVNENSDPQIVTVELPFIPTSEKGVAGGVATLDSNGRVPYSQLPESAMEYKGKWDASTNTPHLEDGVGTNGDFYVCSAPGTVTFGTGNTITFVVNDRVIYDGTDDMWEKLPAGAVSSVNGQTGDVVLDANDIDYSSTKTVKQAIDDIQPVQADWEQSDSQAPDYIKNKIPIWIDDGTNSEQPSSVFDIVHPVGEVYIQYPGKKDPNTLWGNYSTWTDITANYEGAFFRAYKNGTSGDFFGYGDTLGNLQTSQNKSHSHGTDNKTDSATTGLSVNTNSNLTGWAKPVGFTVGDAAVSRSGIVSSIATGLGVWQATGTAKRIVEGYTMNLNANHAHTITDGGHKHTIGSSGGTEARPDNYAIKIWERTA